MKHSIALAAAAAVVAAGLTGPVLAQGSPQTMSLTKVDPQSVATGYRVSKILGSAVVNESGDTVGNIDDLIISADDKVPFAVLSVGGFLGMGTKHVVVSFGELQIRDNEMMLRGATSESLKNLPAFKYDEQQRSQPGAMQNAAPHASLVGKTLRGSEGENIGEIEAIEGNNVIVSVGGFLGIGARDVAIPWSQVTMMGSGEKAELQTSLTRDQIKEMPEHKRGTAPRGGAAR